jgi:hypothetical protein
MGRKRQGCWFCPNGSAKEFAELKTEYPQYWDRLVALSKVPNTVTKCFRYGQTFEDFAKEIDAYLMQIRMI